MRRVKRDHFSTNSKKRNSYILVRNRNGRYVKNVGNFSLKVNTCWKRAKRVFKVQFLSVLTAFKKYIVFKVESLY